jgi:segregation and condensation protein B
MANEEVVTSEEHKPDSENSVEGSSETAVEVAAEAAVEAPVEAAVESSVAEGSPNTAETPDQAQPKRELTEAQKVALLEALLLASGEPLSVSRVQEVMGGTKGEVLQWADQLQAQLASELRGIELVVVAEKLQLRTKADYAEYVRQLMAVRPRKLSNAALETLAVVAYQQPVVKSEIDKIRGVDVAPTLKTLLERKLVKIIGYQASVGQPALYGTTEEFLQVFGLPALSSLPSIQDLKALIKEPGEAQAAPEDDADESPVEEPFQEPSQSQPANIG